SGRVAIRWFPRASARHDGTTDSYRGLPQVAPNSCEAAPLAEWRMRFWTADLHLSHTRILELCPLRPWADLEAMNRGLVERWNQTVGPEDEVWVIGDF